MRDTTDNFSRRVFFALVVGLSLLVLALAVAVIVWRMRLGKEVNARLSALQAAGYPTSGAELNAWYASVPDNENAALKLGEAFELMRSYPDGRSNKVAFAKMPLRGEPLTPELKELLAGHVALNAEALAKAREAIGLPRSRYPVDLSAGSGVLLPHLAKIKALARTADFETRLAVDAGRSAEVITAITTMLGLARTLDAEPVVISQLVRAAMVNMAVAGLERSLAVGEFSDSELSGLFAAFAGAERTNLMAKALIGERAMSVPHFRMSRAEMDRLASVGEAGADQASGPALPGPPPRLVRVTGFFERDLNFFLRAMETNIAVASLPPPWSLSIMTNVTDQVAEAKRRYYILSGLLLPALGRLTTREADGLARLRAAQVALAVERFRLANGKLPKELKELTPNFLSVVPIDPFDGAQLRYKQLPRGYVVYSIGPDGRDDGGTEPPAGGSRSTSAPQDITITVER